MNDTLREEVNEDRQRLLRVIYEPFASTGSWPIWQYVDLTLDALWDLDAAAIFFTLPRVQHPDPPQWSSTYALTWYMNPHNAPQPDQRVALTVAGLRHLPDAEPLLRAFLATVRHLVDSQRKLRPSPSSVVEATVASEEIHEHILTTSIDLGAAPPTEGTMNKVRQLLSHEPILWAGVQLGDPDGQPWTVRVPAALRTLRGVESIDDYLQRIVEWVAPAAPPALPISTGSLDLPYAVGYLDAVWMNSTGAHLFGNLDATSVARLTQPCSSEGEFNSLMSALADVLGQVVPLGKAKPPRGGALEAVRQQLVEDLDAEVAARIDGALATLINLRHIRVGTQHSDARHRAVAAFELLGLAFPPPSWAHAWSRVAALATHALDELREEVHAGLPALTR